jgi:hypothetical protein
MRKAFYSKWMKGRQDRLDKLVTDAEFSNLD